MLFFNIRTTKRIIDHKYTPYLFSNLYIVKQNQSHNFDMFYFITTSPLLSTTTYASLVVYYRLQNIKFVASRHKSYCFAKSKTTEILAVFVTIIPLKKSSEASIKRTILRNCGLSLFPCMNR